MPTTPQIRIAQAAVRRVLVTELDWTPGDAFLSVTGDHGAAATYRGPRVVALELAIADARRAA